jgi:hypothetical protein
VGASSSLAAGGGRAAKAVSWEMLAKNSAEWDAVQSALKALAAFEAKQANDGVVKDETDEVVIAQRRKRALVELALPRFVHAMWSVVDEDPTQRRLNRLEGLPAANAAYVATSFNYHRHLDQTRDPMFWLFVRMLKEKVTRFTEGESTANGAGAEAQPLSATSRTGGFSSKGHQSGKTAHLVSLSYANREVAFEHFTQNSKRFFRLIFEYLSHYVSTDYINPDSYLMLALQKVLETKRQSILASRVGMLGGLGGPGGAGPGRQLVAGGIAVGAWLATKLNDLAAQGELLVVQEEALLEADRVHVAGMQGAFIDFGGPQMLMMLVSLAEPPSPAAGSSAELEVAVGPELFFFQKMLPKAIDFGNALLWGGNTRVQETLFDTFVAKKKSFESYAEEGFLRSLLHQLRDLKSKLLGQRAAGQAAVGFGQVEVFKVPTTTTASLSGKSLTRNHADRFAAEMRAASPEHAGLMRCQQRAIGLLVFTQNLVRMPFRITARSPT